MKIKPVSLRWIAALSGLLLAGALALVLWLVGTEAGLGRVVAVLESLDSVQIRVAGARGRLADSLHVDTLELRTDRLTLQAEDIDLEQDIAGILLGRLAIERLQLASVAIRIGPPTGPPSDQPLRFMPRWLSLGFAEARIGQADIELPGGTLLEFSDVSAAGRITHARLDLDEAAVHAGDWTAGGSLRLVARRPLRLEGELAWSRHAQPELHGRLQASGDLARLGGKVELLAPTLAVAEFSLSDLGTDLRWQASLDSAAFDLAPFLGNTPFGPLSGQLEGSGTLQAFVLRGHAAGRGLAPEGVDLDASLGRAGSTLQVESLRLSTADGRLDVTTTGSLQLGGDRRLALRSQWAGLVWPLSGAPAVTSPRGRLELEGWTALSFSGDAAVRLPGMPATDVVAAGQADSAGITVQRATLAGAAGQASATAYLGFTPGIPWRVEATLRDVDLGRFRPGFDSRLAFAVAASGAGTGEQFAWAAYLGRVTGRLRDFPVAGAGYVLQSRGRYDFREFNFRVGPAQLDVSGHLDGDTALLARVEAPDLGELFADAAGSVEATLRLATAGAPLPQRPNLKLDIALRGRDLSWGEQRAAVLSVDADVDLSDRESSWLRLRAAGLTVGGQAVDSLRVSLDGLARRHDFNLQVGSGPHAANLIGTGRYDDDAYQLTGLRIESDDPALEPYALEAPLELSLSAQSARLARTCVIYPPRRICLQGEWQGRSGWQATASVTDFPLEALSVDLPRQPGYRGRLDFEMRASGVPGQAWTGTARGSLRDARLLYKTPSGRLEELDLGVTLVQLDSEPARHHLTLTAEDTSALQLRAEATLGRDARLAMREAPLAGSLQLSTTRLGLLPLLVPEIDRAAGALRAELTLSGTPARPVLGGTVALTDGELDLYATNLRLRQFAARVVLLDTGLSLDASGQAGDGSFRTDGRLDWKDGELRGDLTLKGDRLLVSDVPEARIEASPDLKFSIDGRNVAVQGSVTIPAARLEPRQLVGAVLASADEEIVGEQAQQASATTYRARADLRLNLGKKVSLEAFGLRGRLEGTVLAQLRPDEVTTASGELEIEDGKYRAYGKELDVERGRLLFAGGPVTDPGVDLRAGKTLPGYQVGVIVRGRLRKPELSLYSEPPLPQSQIASLLLVGRRLDNLDAGDRQALGGSTGEFAAQGGAILAGQLGRYVGLDEVGVESDSDTGASLVIGKFLSPRLYVGYGISLANAINTFKLRYTIGDHWVIAGEAGQEGSVDIEYTIDR